MIGCVLLSFWTSSRARGHISTSIPTEIVE
jgi:hypothetical protein